MITTPENYKQLLYQIQNPNRQVNAIVPIQGQKITEDQFNDKVWYIKDKNYYIVAKKYNKDTLYYNEPIYEIDLNTRKIQAPPFLSVEFDHNSETIYFLIDRYYDNVDLSTLFCVVQYENASPIPTQRGYIYSVPYFDINGPSVPEGKMIFPWVIEGPATAYSGEVTFSVKFYRIREEQIDVENQSTIIRKEYDYVLNTIPVTSKVLHGLDFNLSEDYLAPTPDVFEEVYQALHKVARQSDLYWITINDDGKLENPNANKNDIILP